MLWLLVSLPCRLSTGTIKRKGVGMEREQSTSSSLSSGEKAANKTPERRDSRVASNIAAYLKEHEDHRASRVMQIHDS
jgi:hypothetical protein